ncbi:MAG: hypothetical protein AAGF31_09300 [Planctomycetota bacterium]
MPKLDAQQVRTLLQILDQTQDEEMTCDDCLPHLAVFVEHDLANKPRPEALKLVQDHLDICPECVEELEVLRLAIESLDTPEAG